MNTNAHRTIGQIAIARFALLTLGSCLLFGTAQRGFAGCDGLGGSGDCSSGSGIYYETNNGFATVTGSLGLAGLDVTIPDTLGGLPVIAIGPSAFAGISIRSVSIPNTVTTIASNAFYDCTAMTNLVLGTSVANIGSRAFTYCSMLTRVSLPNSVTNLDESAFGGCNNLTNVTFGNGLRSIGKWAFAGCAVLASVSLPNSVTNIGDNAFARCSRLTSITIPASVSSIGSGPFLGCTSLSAIIVNALNANFVSVGGVLFNQGQTWLIQYPAGKIGMAYTIPTTVTNVGGGAFASCSRLTSITLPTSIITIGDGAFDSCVALRSVILPSNLTIIGSSAFNGCSGLTSAILGNSVASIGDQAFAYCTSLIRISIPDSVTHIGDRAFHWCSSLTNATIGNGVTNVGQAAFSYCENLSTVSLGSSVAGIGPETFDFCWKLAQIIVNPLNSRYSSLDGVLLKQNPTTLIRCPGGKTGTYVMPESVTRIGPRAFYYCGLTSVTIGSNVTDIGTNAFDSSYQLTSVSIPGSVTNIGKSAFLGCIGLTNVSLGNGILTIDDRAFWDCRGLTSLTLPTSIATIGNSAFAYCSGLTSITIPGSVIQLGGVPFYFCTSLAAIFFEGDAPTFGPAPLFYAEYPTVYYLPGTTGWGTTFDGRPTALWPLPNPVILTRPPYFGVQNNTFGFRVSWATNVPVVVEACTNLAAPDWSPISTNTLASGWSYFSDPQWTSYPSRIYRVRLQ